MIGYVFKDLPGGEDGCAHFHPMTFKDNKIIRKATHARFVRICQYCGDDRPEGPYKGSCPGCYKNRYEKFEPVVNIRTGDLYIYIKPILEEEGIHVVSLESGVFMNIHDRDLGKYDPEDFYELVTADSSTCTVVSHCPKCSQMIVSQWNNRKEIKKTFTKHTIIENCVCGEKYKVRVK